MPEMPEDKAAEMTDAIFAGQKIEAIKVYKECTGRGLKESKDFVDDLERQLRQECPERFGAAMAVGGAALVPDDNADEMTQAIFAGQKIQAIKLCREATGLGLKDAKEYVEALQSRLRAESPEKFTSAAARAGCGAVVLLGGLLVVAAGLVMG